MPAPAKTVQRTLRLTPADDVLLRQAAALVGESVSEFVVESGRQRAEMTLADRTVFILDDDAWRTLRAQLDRPAQAPPEVIDLLRRGRPVDTEP